MGDVPPLHMVIIGLFSVGGSLLISWILFGKDEEKWKD
jgi:hypothetical protein